MNPTPKVFERAPLMLALAAVIWRLRVLLPPHTLPARGDPALPFHGSDLTPQWVPWLRVSIDALWHHGTIAFWDRFTNSGAPQFESPQAGVISLATVLGGVLPIEAAVKWSILAHILAGMFGAYALARQLRTRPPFAALAALSFGLGTYLLDHLHLGHLPLVYAMGLTPWALTFLWTALERTESWWRPACAAGIVLGVEVLEGAATALLYSLVACSLVIVTILGSEWKARLLRIAMVGALAGVCFVATAAPQLLPMRQYLDLTARHGGLTLEESANPIREVAHPLPTITAALVMGLGVASLWMKRQHRAALWLATIVVVAVAVATSDAVYAFFWRYVPGIRYQRIPQRALILAGIAGPPLVAIGAEALWTLLQRWKTVGAIVASVAVASIVYEAWVIAPAMPPMADPRVEQQQNHAMRWLADHSAGSRIHIWEAPTRHWLPDNITVPLGLETINSYTPTEHHEYLPGDFDPPEHRTFLGDGWSTPARFWGLLNVRYVVAESTHDDPNFVLAARVDKCPVTICQPGKSTGPYIYENKEWMPRAWMADEAIALVGAADAVYEAALDVLHMPEFDPRRVVVLQLEAGTEVPRVDQVFSVGIVLPGVPRWRTGEADDAIARMLQTKAEPLDAVAVRRNGPNQIEFSAPFDGWMVASEKLALYAGWSASTRATPVQLFRADGVLTAMQVRTGDVIFASYEPPLFRLGLGMFAAMIAAIVVVNRRVARSVDIQARSVR